MYDAKRESSTGTLCPPGACAVKDHGSLLLGAEIRMAPVQPVIGEPAAQGVKLVVTPPQSFREVF